MRRRATRKAVLLHYFKIMETPEIIKWLRDNSSGERGPAAAAADLIDDLLQRFTKLDKPKYSGDAMLDAVLGTPNAEFRVWLDSLPPSYWVRYDLSAARIGWEAACNHLETSSWVSPVGASESHGKSTKCRRQVPFLSKLTLLAICVYGPVLPMWYLSTDLTPAPTCLLLATQAWVSAGLCLLASSWIDHLNSSTNAKGDSQSPDQ